MYKRTFGLFDYSLKRSFFSKYYPNTHTHAHNNPVHPLTRLYTHNRHFIHPFYFVECEKKIYFMKNGFNLIPFLSSSLPSANK